MNFSKKLRATSMTHNESEDEVSYDGSNGSNGSYIDSEDDCEYQPNSKRARTTTNVSNNGIQRRPTRVPNLKIQNRNALLARENRKRKKEMMDSLEKTVSDLQVQNKKLLKMMKFKDTRTVKLEQEVRYLKSVIANRTEIMSVLNGLKSMPVKVPTTAAAAAAKEEKVKKEVASSHTNGSDTASCETFDDNGSVKAMDDPFLPVITDDFLFTDLEVNTEWDEILKNPFNSATDFSDIQKLDEIELLSPASSPMSEISTEHNYFERTSLMSNESPAGVCVHINSGRVSLEFCSTCHYNSTNSWIASN
jgi:ATF/CREB family transcription factor